MTDIEICNNTKYLPIKEIANKLNLADDNLILYGNDKAKVKKEISSKKGKLILVTAMNPTPYGEGKTTVSIGLADAFSSLGDKVSLALRQPSLGPVFGLKGGATGGGYSQVVPMTDINLHFTGDFHAITSCNNLVSAAIYNHIEQGNSLGFSKILFKRAVDMNDRSLRNITLTCNKKEYNDSYAITSASEIMTLFCLASSLDDLKKRLGNLLLGLDKDGNPITAHDLKLEGALTVLLKDAFLPNLVQTLEGTPAFIHGGPFANIAHGCSSVTSIKLALSLSDYVITEAGFGADLGAEKFFNIKCRTAGINPNLAVCVATIKALKYHGGVSKENLKEENIEALKEGTKNLLKHIDNIRNKFNIPVIVGINKYNQDTDKEIETLENELKKENVEMSLIDSWNKGGEGAIDLAKKVVRAVNNDNKLKNTYSLDERIKDKIKKVAQEIYGAKDVEFSQEALQKMIKIEEMGYGKLPICIAKTQYSLSDDSKKLKIDKPFNITIRDVELKAGAGFVVALAGKIYTMPGLPRTPAAEQIGVDSNGNIFGIF